MRFSIVLIPFPFDDFQFIKVRPALILTNPISIYRHITLAAITSNMQNATEESDFVIMENMLGFHSTGLKKNSIIKLHRLITVQQIHIKKTLGELPASYHHFVVDKLNKLFS